MTTPLNKPVHRQVELKDGRYFASLDPCDGAPSFTLRKARTSDLTKLQMEKCLDLTLTKHKQNSGTREQIVNEIKAKITASDIDYKLKVEILDALIDILEVDRMALMEEVTHDS
jgi:hypothetical protein